MAARVTPAPALAAALQQLTATTGTGAGAVAPVPSRPCQGPGCDVKLDGDRERSCCSTCQAILAKANRQKLAAKRKRGEVPAAQ